MTETMTNYQYRTLLMMILNLIDSGKSIEEIRAKVEKLLEEKR